MRFVLALALTCGSAWSQGRGSNLQVLKPQEVNAAMGMIVRGTGLTCEACHTGGARASDATYEKLAARKMLAMVKAINASTFDGKEVVTCYTCHRGTPRVMNAPEGQ